MDSLLKKYPADLVYDYLQPYAFWLTLARVNAPEYRAKMYYDRMSEIDDLNKEMRPLAQDMFKIWSAQL